MQLMIYRTGIRTRRSERVVLGTSLVTYTRSDFQVWLPILVVKESLVWVRSFGVNRRGRMAHYLCRGEGRENRFDQGALVTCLISLFHLWNGRDRATRGSPVGKTIEPWTKSDRFYGSGPY